MVDGTELTFVKDDSVPIDREEEVRISMLFGLLSPD
jgi:hypothetical protein